MTFRSGLLVALLSSVATAPGGGTDPITSAPPWLISAEVLNDITINTSQVTTGTVKMQSNGCILRIRHNLGAVTTIDFTKMLVYPTDPGWNTDGTPNAAVSRPVPVTALGRAFKPYPDTTASGQAKYTDFDAGADYIDIIMSQQLYNSLKTDSTPRPYKTSLGSGGLQFAAGFINGGSGAGFVGDSFVARSDSFDYPLPVYKHLPPPNPYIPADTTLDLEWDAHHEWAQNNSALACLEAMTWDGTTLGSVSRASAMTESAWTVGGIAPSGFHAPVFKTSISFNGKAHGQLYVRSIAKPWIGPEFRSWDAGVGDDYVTGYTQNLFANFPVFHDKDGTHTPVWTKLRNDGGGTTTVDKTQVFTTKAAALASTGFANADLAADSIVAYNGDATKRTVPHADADNGFIVCPNAVGVPGTDTNVYSMRALLSAPTNILPLTITSESGLPSNNCIWRGRNPDGSSPAGSSSTLQTIATWSKKVNVNRLRLVGLKGDSTGTTGDDQYIFYFTPTLSQPGNPTGPNAVYVIYENCEFIGAGAGVAYNSPLGAPAMHYNYNSKFHNVFSSRLGFTSGSAAIHAGTVVNVGNKFTGDSNMDFTCTTACWMTDGIATVPAGGADPTRGNQIAGTQTGVSALLPVTKQYMARNSRIDTSNWNGAGAVNPGYGNGQKGYCHGLGWAGVIISRYGNRNNTMFDWSDDDIIPGYENFFAFGLSNPSSNALAESSRWNWWYNDAGWVRSDKYGSVKFSQFSKLYCKSTWFNGNAILAPNVAWNSITNYFQGQPVYDPGVGNSKPYQALRNVPAGTPLSDTSYWFAAASTAAGAQAGRVGNDRFRNAVNCYGIITRSSLEVSQPTTISPSDRLFNVVPAGTPYKNGNALVAYADLDTMFINDTSPSGTGQAAADFRPVGGSQLIGVRPANWGWDPFDMTGVARPTTTPGAAGALEIIPDYVPDGFVFTAVTNAVNSTLYTSNTITLVGFNQTIPISITGAGAYSKNGAAPTTANGTAVSGDQIALVLNSSNSDDTPVTTTFNANGVTATYSVRTAAGGTVPVLSAAPVISGMNADLTADMGQLLTATDGLFSGSPTSYSRQWQRDAADISGAVGSTYTPTADDSGKAITFKIIASNIVGPSDPAFSSPVNGFHPSQLSPVILLDAENASSISKTGSVVNSITSTGSVATVLTDASAVTNGGTGLSYAAAGFNGRPCITGNGTNQYLEATTVLPTALAGAAACEIWAVLDQPDSNAVTTRRSFFGFNAVATTSNRVREMVKVRTATPFVQLQAEAGTGSGGVASINTITSFIGKHVVRGIFATNGVTAEVDGTAPTQSASTMNAAVGRMRIGASPTGNAGNTAVPASYSNAPMSAVVIFAGALTTARATSMYRWGKARAGI